MTKIPFLPALIQMNLIFIIIKTSKESNVLVNFFLIKCILSLFACISYIVNCTTTVGITTICCCYFFFSEAKRQRRNSSLPQYFRHSLVSLGLAIVGVGVGIANFVVGADNGPWHLTGGSFFPGVMVNYFM